VEVGGGQRAPICATLAGVGDDATSVLAPYVPRIAAEWDLERLGQKWVGVDATCCFVDISGFTALSERLARLGRIGSEELTDVLNHVFSRMLGIAYSKGGSLLKFGGDALLLAFTHDDHARLAAESAVAMRSALREARTLPTSVGRVSLRMSVGLHSGIFHFFSVGGSHRELIVAGPAATRTTRMEQAADAGEILVSDATAERLPASAVSSSKGDGRILRWKRVVEGGPGPTMGYPAPAHAVEGSIPLALRARLADQASEAEHRLASIAFVKFQGVDDLLASTGPDATADALDVVVRAIQEAADAESVTFLASDIDADGGKIILATGIPLAQDDDEGRLLRAGRAIVESRLPLPLRIGVNRGHVFQGDIGTDFRRTFTVMGDSVNLAARLMAAASPGNLLATATVLDHSRTHFDTEALEPFMVKGKSEPVQAFRIRAPRGVRTSSSGTLPFRGRDKELRGLLDALQATEDGAGTVCVIEAERGAGKTRLVAEMTAGARSCRILALQGQPNGAGVPYLPLRDPLRQVLGIDAPTRLEAGLQLLTALQASVPEFAPLAPLLAPVVDATLPETPESAAVAPQFVRDRMAELVVTILDRMWPGSVVIVAEDAHWFDDTSSEICNRIAAGIRSHPWFLCATRRPEAGGFDPARCDLRVVLAPIDDDAARALVDSSTPDAPLRPHECDAVVARAGGNPLFLEELLRVVHASDIEALPDSLDGVAMREIDSIPSLARRALRLSSVLGGFLNLTLLTLFLRGEGIDDPNAVLRTLDGQLVHDGDDRLHFRHALIREAAYHSLPFRTRLVLHRRVGELIETRSGDLDDVAPILSMHFLEAQDWERTWHYGRRAAQVARRVHALAEAATHLERAATAAHHLSDVDDGEVAQLLIDLGETWLILGDYDHADRAFRRSALFSRQDPLRRARLAEWRARVRTYQGRYSAAIRQVRTGSVFLDGMWGNVDADRVRAALLAREAEVRNLQGKLSQAITKCEAAIPEAQRVGELPALALALGTRDISLMQLGRVDEATHMGRVLEMYEELDDKVNIAATLACLGSLSYYAARWGEAVDYFARSVETASAAGDLAHAAIAQVNLGEIRVNQGHLAEAEALLVPAQRTLESFRFPDTSAWATVQLGRARVFRGDVDAGIAMVRSAVAAFDDIDTLTLSVESLAILAEVLVFAGQFVDAATTLAQGRALEQTLGETPISALLDRVEVTLAVASGDRLTAIARLDRSLDRARRMSAAFDSVVLTALATRIGVTDGIQGSPDIESDLGIVKLMMLPEQ
jgi:class 3 adenylate cyclase/tetratricopeptide (TPR) repeat protein